MQKTDDTTEHATVQDFFKFLGMLVSFIFAALFFFLKLLGSSTEASKSNTGMALQSDLDKSLGHSKLNDQHLGKYWNEEN